MRCDGQRRVALATDGKHKCAGCDGQTKDHKHDGQNSVAIATFKKRVANATDEETRKRDGQEKQVVSKKPADQSHLQQSERDAFATVRNEQDWQE